MKRIRQDKTNYRKRAALLIGRHTFVTIKVSDQNVAAQVLKPTPTGDIVIASAHSRELAKHGWKGSTNSLPACYLTGLLLGKKALEKGTKNAILYIGKSPFTTRVAACLKGVTHSQVNIPVSEESLPPDDRISGQHIAEYAQALKADLEKYKSRFSALLKNGLKPEDYPSHFEEVKANISSGKAVEKPKEAEKPKAEEKVEAKPAKETPVEKKEPKKEKAAPKEKKVEKKEKKPKKTEAKKDSAKKARKKKE